MGKRKIIARPNVVTRKHLRKQRRDKKKLKRKEHYVKLTAAKNIRTAPGQFVKRHIGTINTGSSNQKTIKSKKDSLYDVLNREREKEKVETERLKTEMDKQRKDLLLKANEEEDKIIRKLEKQLGLNKIKNKKNLFTDDGLDYQEQIVEAKKQLVDANAESDFEEDLATVTGKNIKEKKTTKEKIKTKRLGDTYDEAYDLSDNDSDQNNEALSSLNDSELDASDQEISNKYEIHDNEDTLNSNNMFCQDQISDLSDVNDEDEGSEFDSRNDAINKKKLDVWEDIYGRKRDEQGNIIKEDKGTYIPPHLRNKDTTSEKELVHLRRQIKSVLNKLTGTNLHWACSTIENLYSNNSRNSVNTAFADLWIDATVQHAATKDRMMAEHAALVSVLHANVGVEVGAHFLEVLAEKFDMMMLKNNEIEDKLLDNLIAALSHLYSFKVSCLLDDLTEKNIECVLVALRCVGGVLRKEEPLALKTFIQNTQSKVMKLNEDLANGTRIKFLLEVLMAIKNNNLNKIPNYDPSYSEQLKKLTKGVIRRGNYVTSLNITLEDLLKAKERGKWWVVGSAWQGDHVRSVKDNDNKNKPLANFDQKLLDLAKKQRMNTDIRRSIFCVIMSAEDYMDAFEKLQHLGLKGQQEREIVHVLVACCLQEKKYNPYYAILAQKLCDFERKYQLSIQYSVWDKIKELETLSKQVISNLAQFLTHLFIEKGLPLSVLKQSFARLRTGFDDEPPCKMTIYNWFPQFKRGHINLSDEFRDGCPSIAVKNKNIVHAVPLMIETDTCELL
ncbi:Nucleolar MIF4G domain-containing protein 1 homolog [Eumeta japonica]|uniref:Nucleolar MIF4G domain-containing protein 1 homolog n=1 Tax=Eumeta variegata TaxID=151549 RepID=A0A4C1WEG7_EUMVA|nr:Nucleolar MIF4G domain-containing protein 1 homolog [Eumeta japonica]